jgi:hypothetical protein
MDKDLVRKLARREMPAITPQVVPGTTRFDVIAPLAGEGLVGIELGVAAGSFSARMVRSGRFALFFGVDAYAGDGHGVAEYRRALMEVGLASDYRLLRMTFAQALDLFPDGFFDFIYCDGYAHTGEEGGQTITDWYPKLKPGGVMAGDDYDAGEWPLVVWAVHHAVAQTGAPLQVTEAQGEAAYGRYRSWFFVKPEAGPERLEPCGPLLDLGRAARDLWEERRRARRAAAAAAVRNGPARDS